MKKKFLVTTSFSLALALAQIATAAADPFVFNRMEGNGSPTSGYTIKIPGAAGGTAPNAWHFDPGYTPGTGGDVVCPAGDPQHCAVANVPVTVPGGITRSVLARAQDVVNVLDMGAVGDASTVANAAIQAAFNKVATSGGTVYFPCGTYKLTTQINITVPGSKAVSVRSEGHDCTTLYFSGTNGLNATYGNQWSGLLIADFTIATDDSTGSYTGFAAKLPTANSYAQNLNSQATTVVRNVVFRGMDRATTGANYWNTGESFTNVSNVSIIDGGFYGGVNKNTATISIGSPAVVTEANNFVAGQAVQFSTTGSLPTGINANQVYYVFNPTSTSYQLVAVPGSTAAVTTSGSQSGTHTVTAYRGTGIVDAGLISPQSYAGVFNVRGFQGNTGYLGFYYGDFVQGVTITGGTNFTLFGTGVAAIPNPTGIPDQLLVSDSQFNTLTYGVQALAMNGLQVHHNTFIVTGGKGISGYGNNYAVDHNNMQNAAVSTQTTTALSMDTPVLIGGTIDLNTIQNFTVPLAFPVGTFSYAIAYGNNIKGTTGPWYVVASGDIGVSISDPTYMTVAQLNARLPCTAAAGGANATVIDSSTSTYAAGLAGGGIGVANAICQGASAAYVAH